jgi:hypothetical protein
MFNTFRTAEYIFIKYFSTLRMEAACSSKTAVMLYQTTHHRIPEVVNFDHEEFCYSLLAHSKFD